MAKRNKNSSFFPGKSHNIYASLDPKHMGIAAGIIAAATIFFGTLIALSTGMGMTALEIWGSFHPGYSVSIFGSVVGLIYGFICWFVAGYVFGWLYNRLGSKSKK